MAGTLRIQKQSITEMAVDCIVNAANSQLRQGGSHNEEKLLYRCYQNAMKVAYAKGCRSIAFPLISSSIYGYPVKDAWRVAIKAIRESPFDMDVTIAVIDGRALQLGTSILSQEAKTASPTR